MLLKRSREQLKRAASQGHPLFVILIAGPLRSSLRLLHPFRHLRFDSVEVKARTALHRRIVEEGLEFLAYHLLNEHEAPELVFEPVEILLSALFRPIVWPAGTLERIEPQVGDVRHIGLRLFTQPAGGLIDEAEF